MSHDDDDSMAAGFLRREKEFKGWPVLPIAAMTATTATGWQPIETAPKDLCPLPVLWNGKFKAAFWNEDQNNWQEYPDGDFDIGGEVTHWFDLPEPPK